MTKHPISYYLPTFQDCMYYLGWITGFLGIGEGSALLLFPSIVPDELIKAGLNPLVFGLIFLLAGIATLLLTIFVMSAIRYGGT